MKTYTKSPFILGGDILFQWAKIIYEDTVGTDGMYVESMCRNYWDTGFHGSEYHLKISAVDATESTAYVMCMWWGSKVLVAHTPRCQCLSEDAI